MEKRPIVLFDIDGTLLSSGGAGRAAMEAAFADVFGIANGLQGVVLSGRTDRWIATQAFSNQGIDDTDENWNRFIQQYFAHIQPMLHRHGGEVLPGVGKLLELLLEQAGIVGLLTGNTRHGAGVKLGHFGLAETFDFGGFGDIHRDRRHVAIDALAAARAVAGPVAAEEVWVIGDTPWDIDCAHAAGMRVLAVATGQYDTDELASHRPDLLLADLSDPAPFLRRVG